MNPRFFGRFVSSVVSGVKGEHRALVRVDNVSMITSTVRHLELGLDSAVLDRFSFVAGQWVNVVIPSLSESGLFSLCTAPSELPKLGLAIKRTNFAPAKFLFDEARVGSEFMVETGGEFCCNFQEEDRLRPIVLLAGGIGVAPLRSMFFEYLARVESGEKLAPMTLVATAVHEKELPFWSSFVSHAEKHPKHIRVLGVIAPDGPNTKEPERIPKTNSLIHGRVGPKVLESILPHNPKVFLCGPRPFVESIPLILTQNLGLHPDQIFYEKWWH